MGAPYMVTYGATKAFDMVMAESLLAEVNRDGVDVFVPTTRLPSTESVNVIAPLAPVARMLTETFPRTVAPLRMSEIVPPRAARIIRRSRVGGLHGRYTWRDAA